MKRRKKFCQESEFVVEHISADSDLNYILGKDTHLDLVIICFGSKDINASVKIVLKGTGASAQIWGFTIGKKETKTNLQTLQLHDAPQTTSNLLVKSLLNDNSSVSYDGRIVVSKKAHLTDAYQRNENLLLSDGAKAVSKPTLEIEANDVRCTHGSTTGTLDREALWYLSTRGIGKETAEKLLTGGFLESAISLISDKMERIKVRRYLWQILSK